MLLSNTGNRPNPLQARESRRLKIAGLVLIGVALPALFFLMDQVESKAWLTYQDNRQVWSTVLLYLVAANLFALGLIVLLAGLKNLPLLTDVQAKKGALVKLAGANLLIVLCLGFVALGDIEALGESWRESWIVLFPLAFFVFAGRAGVVLLRRGWKYDAIPAEKLLEQDQRPPVVYIRSFKDDNKIIVTSSRARSLFSVLQWAAAISAEQELAMIMNRVGPVVAIGKPGESLPELGAARLYVGDDEWQAKITDLMKQARLVVIRAGATANLWWEIDQCAKLLPPRQLLLVSFGQGEDAKIFEKDVEHRFGRPESLDLPRKRSPFLWLMQLGMPLGVEMGRIIYFGHDSMPIAEPVRFTLRWRGLILSPYRPYQESLESAFRRVFGQLDLPWIDRKNRTTAAMLALFVGWLGFHHFYLGDRRRGIYYLGFFWTLVPLFLGWIDGVRLALMDEQEFEQKFVHQPRA
jgi:TM2 domain-containing membrane protein YozV